MSPSLTAAFAALARGDRRIDRTRLAAAVQRQLHTDPTAVDPRHARWFSDTLLHWRRDLHYYGTFPDLPPSETRLRLAILRREG